MIAAFNALDEYAYETIDQYDSEETREDNQPWDGGKFMAIVIFPIINSKNNKSRSLF